VWWRASSALHQGFDLCGTRESASKWLICYSWKLLLPRRLGGGRIRWSSQEDCVWLRISCCERYCAHLTGAVKGNSSGIEVWSGSLVLTGSRSSGALIEERLNIESTSTWIRGDRQVIDTMGYKFISQARLSLCSFYLQVLYFEHLFSRDWILSCHPRMQTPSIGIE
jgi:hypothetical protein